MRELSIIKVVARRPYGPVAFTGRNLPGYRESDRDYVENNMEAAVALLDRELRRARNAKRKNKAARRY